MMHRRVVGAAAQLVVAASLAAPALAARLEVAIVAPDPGIPVFGLVTVEAEVYPVNAEVESLDLFVDGLLVGSLSQPPWRLVVDLGEGNREHRFEIIARGADGATASAELETAAIATNDEVDVDLRQLFVVVEDRDGNRVLDLDASSFEVRDSGVRQRLDTVAGGEVPFSAVLLVDASTSMRGGKLARALEGARSFLGRMERLDEARVVLFADRRIRATPFTGSVGLLELALSGAEPGGGTALNDALAQSLIELETRKARRLIVLLSDGVDVESLLSIARVREMAQRSQAVLYWIRLAGGDDPSTARTSAWRDAEEHQREVRGLAATIEESGGRIISVASVDETATAFAALIREVREQYVLGYRPSEHKGPGAWHPIEVRIDRPRLLVRTRRGWAED